MSTPPRRFYRSTNNRVLAGICGGLGEYFNIDPVLVRLGFILVSLLPGPSLVFYVIAWFIIPKAPRA